MFSRKDFLKLSFLVSSAFWVPRPGRHSLLFAESLPTGNAKQNSPSERKSKKKAIVIGAGISGLTCARKLRESGWEVEVWEARNRIGGRIHTYRGWGYPMDLGASWIHGIDKNPIYKIARDRNLKLHVTDYNKAIFYKDGKPLSYWTMLRALWNYSSVMDEMEQFIGGRSEDMSLRDVYTRIIGKKNYPEERKEIVEWLYHWLENDIAEDGEKISAKAVFEMEEGFSGDEVIFQDGYEGIVKFLAEGLDIKTGIQVGRIRQDSRSVTVESNRLSQKADIAIVTVPLGVIQRNKIQFAPDLPKPKKTSLANLGMGLLNKLYIEFDDIFWDKDKHFIGISEKNHFFDGFINMYPFYKKPTLIGFTHGSRARELENSKDRELRELTARAFSHALARKIPEPRRVFPTRWERDPFTYGSYSFIPIGKNPTDIQELSQPVGRVHFAGEHTSPEYFGYVHGAFLSGIREAETLLI